MQHENANQKTQHDPVSPTPVDLDDVDLACKIILKLGRAIDTGREPVSQRLVHEIAALIAQSHASRLSEKDAEIRTQTARGNAFEWGYGHLQSRMESIDRPGWAHDCDGEIEHRIESASRLGGASAQPPAPEGSHELAEGVRKATAGTRPR